MKKREYHIGPGAASLMLVAVVLAMSILGLLSLMNARTDMQMAHRSAGMAEAAAALDSASEMSLARLDEVLRACAEQAEDDRHYMALVEENLPQDMFLQGREVTWTETADNRILECGAQIAPLGEQSRLHWSIHCHFTEFEGDLFL